MTLSDTDTAQLWETFRAGGGAELVRDAVRLVLQELIEAEATEAIGAGRYERSDARVNERNGHRPRLLATQAGDVELRIPKLRKGSLLPSVLEPRRRIDRAPHAVIMEAYVAGVSTRAVDDLVAALGAESGISKSEVSRICAGLDEMVEAFRSRRLDHVEFPYVYVDATYLKVRNSVWGSVPFCACRGCRARCEQRVPTRPRRGPPRLQKPARRRHDHLRAPDPEAVDAAWLASSAPDSPKRRRRQARTKIHTHSQEITHARGDLRGVLASWPTDPSAATSQSTVRHGERPRLNPKELHGTPPGAAANVAAPAELLAVLAADDDWYVRSGVAENVAAPAELLEVVSRDSVSGVRCCLCRNDKAPERLVDALRADPDYWVRAAATVACE